MRARPPEPRTDKRSPHGAECRRRRRGSIARSDPTNIIRRHALQNALYECQRGAMRLELEVWVSGFGGRFPFVEPGTPEPEVVAVRLREVTALIPPEHIRIRVGPLVTMRLRKVRGDAWIISNRILGLEYTLMSYVEYADDGRARSA